MNPSNTQVTPEIKKVIDSNGDGHTVIPTPHTHAQSEVSGLSAALAGKQNTLTFDSTPTTGSTNPVTSGGVKTALNGKADVGHVHDKIQDEDVRAKVECGTVGNTDAGKIKLSVEDSEGEAQTAEITASNIDNLKRALSDPDSTPTSNSTNLVTSSGIKTALDKKLDVKSQGVTIIRKTAQHITPRNMDSDMATLHERHYILQNTGITEPNVSDYFSSSDMTLHYSIDAQIKVQISGWVAICVRRVQSVLVDNNLYITYEGTGRLS